MTRDLPVRGMGRRVWGVGTETTMPDTGCTVSWVLKGVGRRTLRGRRWAAELNLNLNDVDVFNGGRRARCCCCCDRCLYAACDGDGVVLVLVLVFVDEDNGAGRDGCGCMDAADSGDE
jgi:hypothetical protein